MMHDTFLQEALIEAWRARGQTAPNPAVGAVAVKQGNIVARAYHAGVGCLHAEQKLLEDLPEDCSDMTLYVTLEPCNHWGKTPPCVDGIIQRRFKQVVFGFCDPNPVVQKNDTPALLRAKGIDVLHYPMPEIDAFYESYAYWQKTGMPFVTVKVAQSLDGKIATQDKQPIALSNAACAAFTHSARKHSDVILTSTQTVMADNPLLNARLDDEVTAKPIAVVGQTKLDGDFKLFDTAKELHFYETHDLLAVLKDLGAKGYHDVWVEAGSTLFTALHEAGLVNRTHIYLTPHVAGDGISLCQDGVIMQARKKVTLTTLDDNVKMTLDWVR